MKLLISIILLSLTCAGITYGETPAVRISFATQLNPNNTPTQILFEWQGLQIIACGESAALGIYNPTHITFGVRSFYYGNSTNYGVIPLTSFPPVGQKDYQLTPGSPMMLNNQNTPYLQQVGDNMIYSQVTISDQHSRVLQCTMAEQLFGAPGSLPTTIVSGNCVEITIIPNQ